MLFELFLIITGVGLVLLIGFILVSRTTTVQQMIPGIMGYPMGIKTPVDEERVTESAEDYMVGELSPPTHGAMPEVKRERSILDVAGSEIAYKKAKTSHESPKGYQVAADLRVQYPKETFVGKDDYQLRIQIDPRQIPIDWQTPEGSAELKSTLEFLADDGSPNLHIAVSSTALEFSTLEKTIQLRPDKVCEVRFIFHPLAKKEGMRDIMVSIRYQEAIIKEVTVPVIVKDRVIDGLQYHHVRRLKIISTLLSAASGIITTLMQLLGL